MELSSDDPESIQGQLNQCTVILILQFINNLLFILILFLQKEYGELSDLKKEVEHVLREGRRHVEDKKADSKLNTELDAIKALYNKVVEYWFKIIFIFVIILVFISVGDADC
jgi:hypothetical protein